MEFIKRLANNLFGKRKTYDAKELGIFHSKVGIAGKMKAIIGSRP